MSMSDWATDVLGGSWVVMSGVKSRVTILVTLFRVLITLLITTLEPPSSLNNFQL